ncbi:MAG: SbcC/MukB-like Walker B domain-containing protein, partial [Enterococcus casseliflavus]
GESFIAALALAISLADVIQQRAGGIEIEALFIDEGFGSLDEESLEMAMEALEMIENEGRMIGIISHVRELRARILQQVFVETNGSGQSRIRIKE